MGISLSGRSFLTLLDYSPEEIRYLLGLSAEFKRMKRVGTPHAYLAGKQIVLLFEKTSTRTRCSFEVAARDLGMGVTFLDPGSSQMGKKESLADTAKVLGRLFDGIEYRGYQQSVVEDLAKYSGVPVWNGLTDTDHPTQVLADFLTLRENFGKLRGLKLVYLGDGRNNMSNALMIGCAKMGIDYVVSSPKELEPSPKLLAKCRAIAAHSSITVINDPKEAVKNADAVYTDVWVSMGEEALKEERYRLLGEWQVNSEVMAATGKASTISCTAFLR